MATQDFKRKLAAILHADVKGYSRLMGEDEEATVSTLNAYREIMGVFIQQSTISFGMADAVSALESRSAIGAGSLVGTRNGDAS